MNNVRYRQRRERYSRFQWTCRRLCGRAVTWGVFSYAFIAAYGALYGSGPALVHRLGLTLTVICAGFAGLFVSLFVLSGVAAGVDKWRYRRGRKHYG